VADPIGSIDALKKAVEFAHYLAKDAEEFLVAVNERDALLLKIEEGEEVDEATLQHANESVVEFTRGLRSGVYEFRKRAERIASQDGEAVRGAAATESTVAPAAPGGTGEVPDYVPAAQRGTELVTYWLYYGGQCVGTKRMPVGTGAVDVRKAALPEAVIFCDRGNFENPVERQMKIRRATVKVFDDRPKQESMRRARPFELRGLFANEKPFLELTFRSPLTGAALAAHIGDVTVGLQNVAGVEGLELSAKPRDGVERMVRIESDDRDALGRVEVAMKAYLVERGAELVSEFGVGYVRIEEPERDTETETERPLG